MKRNVLAVDDDPLITNLIKRGIEPHGYRVICAASGQEAMELSDKEPVDLAILDFSLPDMCGEELYRRLRSVIPDLPVIILTGHPNLEAAVNLMKKGVRDYLTKPFSLTELVTHIRTILQNTTNDPQSPSIDKSAVTPWYPGGYIFGNSEVMQHVDTQIRNLPRYPDTTVLISGPTGTGKSMVARRIHELTWDRRAPYVEIDCSTIPRELCESELFGHEKGSFTGAHRSKPGLFEAGGNGTVFLDEIGELDLPLQVKLLRVLESRQFKRVGGETMLPMSARVIAATNRCLPDLIQAGKFREDLYFRLNVFELWMPPLKERGDDILMLARHFLNHFAGRHRKNISGFTPEALSYLRSCDYPGNVRELRNMIERAVINSNTSLIHFAHLVSLHRRTLATGTPPPPEATVPFPAPSGSDSSITTASLNLASLEKEKLLQALAACNGNKSKAASMVGLSRTAYHRRLLKHQVPCEITR